MEGYLVMGAKEAVARLIEEKLWQPRRKRVKCAYVKNE